MAPAAFPKNSVGTNSYRKMERLTFRLRLQEETSRNTGKMDNLYIKTERRRINAKVEYVYYIKCMYGNEMSMFMNVWTQILTYTCLQILAYCNQLTRPNVILWVKIFMYVPLKECCLFVIVLKFIKIK